MLKQQELGHDGAYSARAHKFSDGGQQVDGEYEQVHHAVRTVAPCRYLTSRSSQSVSARITNSPWTGTFGKVEINVPRARLEGPGGKTTEWRSSALRAYQRRTLAADALIASAYLAGTNTRRVRRALTTLFRGAVGKDTVSRVWRKVKSDWEAWNARPLAAEPIVRLILDGTVVRVRLDRKATSISLLVVIGVRADGQKMLLAIKGMGGESTEAWRAVLDDLIKRGLRRPEFLIVDGAPGSRTRSPPSGTACRCSDARFTSTGTCSRMRPSGCTRRSPPTTPI